MKPVMMLSVLCIASAIAAHAQETPAPAFDPGNKVRLDQTEASLVQALESDSPGLQATACQTVRDLKALIPDQSFSCIVIPLMRIVKDGDAAVEARILAAIALHELHSEKGDFAIKGEAKFSNDGRFRYICTALAVERVKELQLARTNADNPQSPAIATTR